MEGKSITLKNLEERLLKERFNPGRQQRRYFVRLKTKPDLLKRINKSKPMEQKW